jgi:hypothetical protein
MIRLFCISNSVVIHSLSVCRADVDDDDDSDAGSYHMHLRPVHAYTALSHT